MKKLISGAIFDPHRSTWCCMFHERTTRRIGDAAFGNAGVNDHHGRTDINTVGKHTRLQSDSKPSDDGEPAEYGPIVDGAAGRRHNFHAVMTDGPRAGTWEVTAPAGEVATCQYLPDLERWIATWLGTPPLSFIDVRGDDDPFLLFTFSDEPNELGFLPTGDISFEADDRGDTATLVWVSESSEGKYRNSANETVDTVDVGQTELTIECGSIFRYPV